ncbi:MAG TPA: FHA domain-containing protein, partial [Microterricola sp.]
PFGGPVQPAAPPIPATPAFPAEVVAPAGVAPAAVAPAAPADEAVQEVPTVSPVFSYTPAVIATPAPAPAAPPAPIEMPEELSVRVEQPAGAPGRAAAPLIDSVPDFSSPAAPVTAGAAGAAAAASVVLDEQRAETPSPQPVDDDDDMDATVISGRRNKAWVFETESGQRVPLSAELVLLGRNPAQLADHPDAQLITVRDAGRTVSKTHASVQLQGAAWVITDLNSTNGVYVLDAEGAEIELEPGIATEIAGRFVLGELSARIFQEE